MSKAGAGRGNGSEGECKGEVEEPEGGPCPRPLNPRGRKSG